MRVAIVQMHSDADVEANLTSAERLVREAAEGGADVAVLPEYLEFMGPSVMRGTVANAIPGPTTDRLGAVAADRGLWVLAGGLLESEAGRIYDTAALLDRDGQVAATYRKIHLFDVDLPDQPPLRESETITAGDRVVTHEVEGVRVGLSICYDVRFPELYRALMTSGAEVVFVPAQFQYATGRDHWHALLRARAIENQCFVVAPGQWGSFGERGAERRSYGHSLVVDPWGAIVVEAPEEGDGVWFADLDLDELRRLRRTFPVLAHRRIGSSC